MDNNDIQVKFTIGPAYFGEPRLVRDVFEIIMQAAMGHTRKIVTYLEHSRDPEIGVLAEVAVTAHPDAPKIISASIKQAMNLPDSIPILIIFEESDVMRSDNLDDLIEAVRESQKGLKQITDGMFDRLLGYW